MFSIQTDKRVKALVLQKQWISDVYIYLYIFLYGRLE